MALRGIKLVEFAGLAPSPVCSMFLADHGAQVVRIDRTQKNLFSDLDVSARGKRSIALDLKRPTALKIARQLCDKADILIEPFRPGVMERLGLGPDELLSSNPRLIYTRLSGYGNTGPWAQRAGHDINYLSMTGVLSALGAADSNPSPPVNLLADFAGGSLMTAFGIVLALYARDRPLTKIPASTKSGSPTPTNAEFGKGQVVDSPLSEGGAYVSSWLFRSRPLFFWVGARGRNILDGGAHYYTTYKTRDDKYMAVGALEPQFYERFLRGLGLTANEMPQIDIERFPEFRERIAALFRERTRDEWARVYEPLDACVTPVLEFSEAPLHPQNVARAAFLEPDPPNSAHASPLRSPAPAPRLSRTPATASPDGNAAIGQHTREILSELGFAHAQVEQLIADGTAQTADC